ncbi:RNA methyltransferase [Synechococcus sp. WH 8020]|uniref:23S rRNA (uracil(1939)-C(5))-methyltransferase RlmD n=1 Tax=Synechococcus sp. (strain WH8020) TaxID=32052 RepID=UPI00065276A9|nr:23S rRNA (uracil(1939)-C(5))-methyltransferase RlmD [Synechococcus sp. WH 8020]AKN60397.1 RNA methyltransferase [Synechococcus sp. WH 8020]
MAQSLSDPPVAGQIITVLGSDLNHQGLGLARWQGWVVIVPQLLPGEEAQVQLLQRKKSQWFARHLKTLVAGPGARKSPCILAQDCGGCSLQHLEDSLQAEWKRTRLEQTLRRIGGIDIQSPAPINNDLDHLGYRNRALIPLLRREDQLRLGYYRRGSHRIVNLNRCPVLDPRIDALIKPLKQDLEASGWPADADLHGEPGLRHLGLRVGVRTGELLITLVSATAELNGVKTLAEEWMNRWPALAGVTLNLQPRRSNTVLGAITHTLAGRDCISERFCDLQLLLGTTTFFQVNTDRAEQIVIVLRDWLLQLGDCKRLIDAYCGIGTISLPIAAAGIGVVGLEINPASVQQARQNAALNGITEASFEAGDVALLLGDYLRDHDALVVDPPRKGLTPDVLNAILNCPPKSLAYLSCDSATLARDIKRLVSDNGPYAIDRIQPVDFFPQTTHLECLVLMKRINFEAQR